MKPTHSAYWTTSWGFVTLALICLPFADLEIISLEPWQALGELFGGLLAPEFAAIDELALALATTVAFALLGVAAGSMAGFGLALVFHWRWIRISCALIRAVHELFWALIFLQIFGLHPLTGLLAIGLPYMATFAKVYSEILEEGDRRAWQVLANNHNHFSTFIYTRLPDLWVHFKTYTLYRVECGLRSSAVLGFVGLPTLGYTLSSAFMQGHYGQLWALLILFYVLIATIRYWLRPRLLPFYIPAALAIIANDTPLSLHTMARFFSEDIVPAPIRNTDINSDSLTALWHWFAQIFSEQALPGIINTLLLTQIALVATGILTLLLFPWISRWFMPRLGQRFSHAILVVLRSTPEYILAYIFLQLWGPSMLPAVIALALHNGAIIGHLSGRYADDLRLRPDHSRGLNLYFYEIVPRIYAQFLAFLFYRWEIILRETAILGILGIATLGFYIDSAIQDIRMDRALLLIAITALLNVFVDGISRWLRSRLRLTTTAECN